MYIGGEKIWTDNLTPSVNPAEPTEIVGYGTEAGVDEAERAVKAARAAFEKWRWTPFEERAQLLERAADILERRRYDDSLIDGSCRDYGRSPFELTEPHALVIAGLDASTRP